MNPDLKKLSIGLANDPSFTLTGKDFKSDIKRAKVTPATPPPPPPAQTNAMIKGVADQTQNIIKANTAEADRLSQLRTDFAALGQEGTLADLNNNKLKEFGVTPEALKELQDIQLRLNETDTRSEVQKTQIENAEGQTIGQAQREVNQEDRENAVRRAGDAARAAVLQGNIETGRSLARDAVDIAYKDREMRNQALIQQINDMQGVVDDQTAQLLEQDKRKYEAETAKIQEVKNAISEALVQGATQSEVRQLNDKNLSDEEKLALAQSIIARGNTPTGGTGAPTVKTINGVDMQWNPTTQQWETIAGGGAAGGFNDPANLDAKYSELLKDIGDAKTLADNGAIGAGFLERTVKGAFTSNADYNQVQNIADTIKSNLLTLNTDPNIKKFFGPQMSNRDTELMTAAGSTLDPNKQTPEQFKRDLEDAAKLIARARTAVAINAPQQKPGNIIVADDGTEIEIIGE